MTANLSEQIEIATDVLVIGAGSAAARSANEISASGYRVTLLVGDDAFGRDRRPAASRGYFDPPGADAFKDEVKKAVGSKQVEILSDAELLEAAGMPGDFTVKLKQSGKLLERKAGAIVVAGDIFPRPLNEAYGLKLSDTVVSQSQLETLLDTDKEKLAGKTVAFLVGFGQEGNPLVMERVFRSVLAATAVDGCQVYVYCGNLKVAADGLERQYLESRQQGAIYFKLKTAPAVSPDGRRISFQDPALRNELELALDLLVVEEALEAEPLNRKLAELLRIDLGPAGFLQSDNVHRFPVGSNREGVYLVGASRDVQNLPGAFCDVGNAILRLKEFLGAGRKTPPAVTAVVDRNKCCICLTCYRSCPHGAIDYDDKAIISPLACQACGICAAECPMDAIQVAEFEDRQILEQITAGTEPQAHTPRLVAFCCQNSAFEAARMAEAFHMRLPAGLQIIKVPCAGKVDLDYVLNAFAEGADGVLVMTCHPGNCKSETGNTHAQWRVELAWQMMTEAGLDKDRLKFVTLASNMATEFVAAVTEMEKTIQAPESTVAAK